jgi:hypothetical protein
MSCSIPACGIDWIHSPQPIVLAHWPVERLLLRDFPRIRRSPTGGVAAASTRRRLLRLKDPFAAPVSHGAGLTGEFRARAFNHPDDVHDLDARGTDGNSWIRSTSPAIGRTGVRPPYLARVRHRQGGYVEVECGWFSDRSLCYLAPGDGPRAGHRLRPMAAAGEACRLPRRKTQLDGRVPLQGLCPARRAARALARWFGSDRIISALSIMSAPRVVNPRAAVRLARQAPTAELRPRSKSNCSAAGVPRRQFQRSASAIGLSVDSGLEQSRVGLADGRGLTLMFKDLGRDALLEDARRA